MRSATTRRDEQGFLVLALAALIAAGSAVILFAAGDTIVSDGAGTSTGVTSKIPPIDAEAPAEVETMTFGLG